MRPESERRRFPDGSLGPDPRWFDPNFVPRGRALRERPRERAPAANREPRHNRTRCLVCDLVIERQQWGKRRYCENCYAERDRTRRRRLYAKRREARLCTRCGKIAATDCGRCAACARQRLKHNRQYLTDRRRAQARRDKGQCPRCTAPLDAGCTMCAGCLSDRRRARREKKVRWMAARVCVRCGGKVTKPNVITCGRCRAYKPRYAARNREAGMCCCGDFRVVGLQTCPRCREYWRRAAAKYREKRAKQQPPTIFVTTCSQGMQADTQNIG